MLSLVSAGAFRMDEGRFCNGRPPDFLCDTGAFRRLINSNANGLLFPQRVVQRPDNAHVSQTFPAGRLRVVIFQDAIGEIQEFGAELVGLAELMELLLSPNRDF